MSETPTPSPAQTDIVQIIIAIVLPPLAVFLKEGIGKNFWINVVLTFLLFYIPGAAHAIWLILKK